MNAVREAAETKRLLMHQLIPRSCLTQRPGACRDSFNNGDLYAEK